MGSARDPDGWPGRDGERDDVPEPVSPPDNRASDRSGEDGIYEEPYADAVYSEDAGYVDDADGPVGSFFPGVPVAATRETVVAREEERFGGIKIGSAFFGWLTATAMAVLLAALVAAAGMAGLLTGAAAIAGTGQASSPSAGMSGAIMLLVILFLAYFSGGYVAGRMARFNGVGQGLMVWLWTVIAAAAVVLLAIVGGGQFNVLATLNSFLSLPVGEGQLSTTGIIAAIAAAATALLGAVLGAMAGVHYHRKVDRVGFTPTEYYE
jgi:hypothetical protein